MKEADAVFQAIDTDASGAIDFDELAAGLTALRAQAASVAEQQMSLKAVLKAMQAAKERYIAAAAAAEVVEAIEAEVAEERRLLSAGGEERGSASAARMQKLSIQHAHEIKKALKLQQVALYQHEEDEELKQRKTKKKQSKKAKEAAAAAAAAAVVVEESDSFKKIMDRRVQMMRRGEGSTPTSPQGLRSGGAPVQQQTGDGTTIISSSSPTPQRPPIMQHELAGDGKASPSSSFKERVLEGMASMMNPISSPARQRPPSGQQQQNWKARDVAGMPSPATTEAQVDLAC